MLAKIESIGMSKKKGINPNVKKGDEAYYDLDDDFIDDPEYEVNSLILLFRSPKSLLQIKKNPKKAK